MTFIKALSPRAVLALPGLLAVCFAAAAQTVPQPRLETVQLSAGMHLIRAEVAVTPVQQATGMMFRTAMGANEGMPFVNADSGVRCFWMRNTLIPLSAAFLADCSVAPVRFALEMNQGWFAKRGIKPGQRLRGGPFGP